MFIAGIFQFSLVQIAVETQQKESAIGRQRRASESDTTIDSRAIDAGKSIDGMQKNVDIMQMLSKAQDEYDKVTSFIRRLRAWSSHCMAFSPSWWRSSKPPSSLLSEQVSTM